MTVFSEQTSATVQVCAGTSVVVMLGPQSQIHSTDMPLDTLWQTGRVAPQNFNAFITMNINPWLAAT